MTPQHTHELVVNGMSCQHCVKAVTRAIQALDPQAIVEVNLPASHVSVRTILDASAVKQAITEEGYEVPA